MIQFIAASKITTRSRDWKQLIANLIYWAAKRYLSSLIVVIVLWIRPSAVRRQEQGETP